VLVVAGQIDTAKTLAYAAQTVGALPRPSRRLEETYTVEPPQDGERYVELRRVGTGQEVMIAYHAPAMAHPDAAALRVLTGILNGGNGTGRFPKALVDNRKALSARISFEEMHDPGFVVASATLSGDQSVEDVRKAMIETIAGIVKEPPTKDEVERVKTRMIRQTEQSMASSQQVGMALTGMIADGDWRLYFLSYDEVKKVTPEDIVRVAKTYFKDSNRTVGVFIPTASPDRTDVPATPDLNMLFDNYKTTLTVSDGEAFDPTPANIEKHITRAKLSGGLRLAMLPKTTRGAAVTVTLELRFGDETSLAGKAAVAQITGALLMRGTKSHTRQQLQDEMDKLNARIAVGGGGGTGGGGRGAGGRGGVAGSLSSASASLQTTAASLAPALKLAVEILREPAFPEADFEQIRKQQIGAVERGRTEPAILAVEALQRNLSVYPRGDVRYVRSIDEQIEELNKVTLDDVKKFHAQFYGASDAILVAVGQFVPGDLQQAAEQLLGAWKSPSHYARVESRYGKVAPIDLKIETPDKQNAQFEAGMRIQMSDQDPDYAALRLANYIFGGSITSRLPNRVRNNEGLSYSVSSRFTAPASGDSALFSALAISNPKNAPKVEASFRDELAKTLASGFTAEEVATAKKAFRDQSVVARSQEQALPGLIMALEQNGRTLLWDEQQDEKIEALTPAQVTAAFRKRVDPAGVSIVKAGDFKAAGVYQ
jgi:zinc protease